MSKPAAGTPPHTHTHTHTHGVGAVTGIMAAVGAGVSGVIGSWFLPSGVVGSLLLLLLLSILLTALCSECSRRSFELQESERDTNHSTLISVVKLEEPVMERVNPVISDIQNDEKGDSLSFTSWRSHLEAPPNNQDVQTNGCAAVMEASPAGQSRAVEENSVQFTAWRSHLRAPEQQDVSSADSHSDHIYHSIGGGRADANTVTPPRTNPDQDGGGDDTTRPPDAPTVDFSDRNSVYAQVSKKVRQAPPPAHTAEVGQVRETEEGEEPLPPLPDRETEKEG
ncbi:uncharacterized protein [Paralichthys olivaceus]|uniref:uncharacterized protein isoform X1 n=1 Tax=Paralichthys olivaceus TaxID=8255 RepID=UPI003751EC8F